MAENCFGQGIVVVGGQWGDEGKGRIVDTMAETCDVVVRFQGGNNAGHSLHIGEQAVVLHLVPCGIMRPEKINMIGNGVVIDPEVLFHEIDMLRNHGVEVSPKNLRIAKNAQVIFPFHKELDAARESVSTWQIGTTKRGIGPCYEDKVARLGIHVQDLIASKNLVKKLQKVSGVRQIAGFDLEKTLSWARAMGDRLAPFFADVGDELEAHLKSSKRVLFEGAQGALLDVDHGTYPFVTSSNCVAAQAAIGSGIGTKWLSDVLIVTKAYCTRVGEGPFFSETDSKEQEIFRRLGNEFGATTGRPRRCGWLDLPALKYAARINGATGIVLTKVDILSGLGPIRVGTSYVARGEKGLSFLDAMAAFHEGEHVSLEYRVFDPVGPMPSITTRWSDFPASLRALCELMENYLELPIRVVSYGKERGQEFFITGLRD